VLYGVPVGPSKLAELDQLAKDVTIRLLIDNSEHVSILSQYKRCPENHGKPWSVFIKLDMGTFRAGLPLHSPALGELVHAAEDSSGVEIYGFYSYSAKASAGRSVEDAETVLQEHIKGVLQASKLVRDQTLPLTLSIGSSPTARVIGPIREQIGANIKFEIHAGQSKRLKINPLGEVFLIKQRDRDLQ
jgi:D-serine deaminase-like pyridoxal phosphate-dependent protein